MNTTLHTALESEPFLKAFCAYLVKAEAKPVPSQAFTLFRWTGLVLRFLNAGSALKAATKLIECQAGWLDLLVGTCQKWRPIQRSIDATLLQVPALFAVYQSTALAKGSGPLVQALFSHATKLGEHKKAEVVPALLTVFVDKVLSSKDKVPHATMTCYKPLLDAATGDQVNEVLVPAAVRMCKRSPENALSAVVFMLSSLTTDLSTPSSELMPVFLQQARHAKDTVRQLAVNSSRALAAGISDPSVVQTLINNAVAVLNGSAEGKIKSPPERVALAQLIEALGAAPGRGAGISAAATTASEFACSFYKEEISEEGKMALLSMLSVWLPRCLAFPDPAIKRFSEGLKEKDALRRAHLRTLATTLSAAPEFRSQAGELAPGLAQTAADGCSKVAMRLDGVLSLLCAAYIAAADATGDAALKKGGVWDLVGKDGSALLMPSTAGKLPGGDAGAAAELAGVMLTQHAQHLGGLVRTLLIFLIFTILHSNYLYIT